MITWAAVKLFLGGAWGFVKSIPWQFWLFAAVVAVAWYYGEVRADQREKAVRDEWDAAIAEQVAADAAVKTKQAAVTTRVEIKYLDRIKVVREKGATIIKEVPRYVSATDCPLSPGFRVLHDAAAEDQLPDPAAVTDAAPVPAPDAASTVADNYYACHETAARLTALQEWVRDQAAITGQPAGAEQQPAVREAGPGVAR